MLSWDGVRDRDETRCVDELSLFYDETICEEWPLSEWANVSYSEIVNEKQNDEHFGEVSKWTKTNEWTMRIEKWRKAKSFHTNNKRHTLSKTTLNCFVACTVFVQMKMFKYSYTSTRHKPLDARSKLENLKRDV